MINIKTIGGLVEEQDKFLRYIKPVQNKYKVNVLFSTKTMEFTICINIVNVKRKHTANYKSFRSVIAELADLGFLVIRWSKKVNYKSLDMSDEKAINLLLADFANKKKNVTFNYKYK